MCSWLVSGVLMYRPYKLTLLFVQARFQESRFIWPTCWELFGCLASCVQIGSDYRVTFFLSFFCKTEKNLGEFYFGGALFEHISQTGGLKNSPLSGLLSWHAPLIHFICHWGSMTEKGMSNLKYYTSNCVWSKPSITQLGLVMCLPFILGLKNALPLFTLLLFLPLILIYYHACIISCQPQLSVHLSLCFLLPPP